jgi:hypothetical protein
MQVINFTFSEGASIEDKEKTLGAIAGWKNVSEAALLKPESKIDELRRMAFARVDDECDLSTLTNRLKGMPEIQSASTPSARGIMSD